MIDPVLVNIGPITIKWYGLIMALGFLAGIFIATKLTKYRDISKTDIQDFFIYLIPSAIIGARLGHIISIPNYYLQNPIEMIAVWHGGMAFQGGLLGAVIAALIFCKKRKIEFYDLSDILVVPLAFALIFWRIANLINQELYGRLTNLPWGISIRDVEGKRHPSQIYESLKNLIIFITLYNMIKIKHLKKGVVFWSFVAIYSILRFFVEFFRDWDTIYYSLTLSQLISIPMAILAIIMLNKITKCKT